MRGERLPAGVLRGFGDVSPDLTARVMLAVLQRSEDQAWGTTVREVAGDVGCAVTTAHFALRALREEGVVAYEGARTIRPTVEVVLAAPR